MVDKLWQAVKLKQISFACPSTYEITLASGEVLKVRHRYCVSTKDWRVYFMPRQGEVEHLEMIVPEGLEEMAAIKAFLFKAQIDMTNAKVELMPDPNEGWDVNEEFKYYEDGTLFRPEFL